MRRRICQCLVLGKDGGCVGLGCIDDTFLELASEYRPFYILLIADKRLSLA